MIALASCFKIIEEHDSICHIGIKSILMITTLQKNIPFDLINLYLQTSRNFVIMSIRRHANLKRSFTTLDCTSLLNV